MAGQGTERGREREREEIYSRWRSSIQSTKTRPGADCGSDYELLIAKFRLVLQTSAIKTTGNFLNLIMQRLNSPSAYLSSDF